MKLDELLTALETDAVDLTIPAHIRSTIGAAASMIHRQAAEIARLETYTRQLRHDHNNTLQALAFAQQKLEKTRG